MIKSRAGPAAALNDPKVKKLPAVLAKVDPVLWLEKQIQADFQGEVFRISMSGEKPEDLAILVNAVAKAYTSHTVEDESGERNARKDHLQKLYNEYQRTLERQRAELKKLTQTVGANDKETNHYALQLAIERLSTVRRELIQVQSELRRAKAELEIRLAQEKGGPALMPVSEAAIQQYINEDSEVKQIRARIGELNNKITRANRVVRAPVRSPEHASPLAKSRRYPHLRRSAFRPSNVDWGQGGLDGEDAGAQGLCNRIGVLEELAKVTQAIWDVESKGERDLHQDVLYIDEVQEKILHADNAAKRIGEELEVLTVELKAPSRVQQLESADAPRKEEDKRVSMASLAGLGTFGMFVLGVAFLEFRTRRIGSIDEVTMGLRSRRPAADPRRGTPVRQATAESDPYGENHLDRVDRLDPHDDPPFDRRPPAPARRGYGVERRGQDLPACHLATSLGHGPC